MMITPLDMPVGSGHTTIGIAAMPEVLRWESAYAEAGRVHHQYELLLADRLGATLAADVRHPLTGQLREGLAELSAATWQRLLTAPQVSYRLLWPSRYDSASTVRFLAAAVDVELARERSDSVAIGAPDQLLPGAEVSWSVLGDGWLDSSGRFVVGPGLTAFPPIDVGSPHALSIDLEGARDQVGVARSPYDQTEVSRLLHQLAGTRDAMATIVPDLLEFVVAFTKVLVLQPDPMTPTLFSTGSSAQYVGRSVFGNPILDNVDDARLADGLVHEAIHSYMYMNERVEPWVTDVELYGSELRTCSPWTGNPLPLRAYLQACFVWYGLLNFWARAVGTTVLGQDRPRKHLTQAARGFLTGGVLKQIQPFRAGIVPELVDAIERIETEVLEAVDVAG